MYSYGCRSALKTCEGGEGGRDGKMIKIKIKFLLRHNLAGTMFGVWLYLVRRCTLVPYTYICRASDMVQRYDIRRSRVSRGIHYIGHRTGLPFEILLIYMLHVIFTRDNYTNDSFLQPLQFISFLEFMRVPKVINTFYNCT